MTTIKYSEYPVYQDLEAELEDMKDTIISTVNYASREADMFDLEDEDENEQYQEIQKLPLAKNYDEAVKLFERYFSTDWATDETDTIDQIEEKQNEISELTNLIDKINKIIASIEHSDFKISDYNISNQSISTYINFSADQYDKFKDEFVSSMDFDDCEVDGIPSFKNDTFQVRISDHDSASRFNEYSFTETPYSPHSIKCDINFF